MSEDSKVFGGMALASTISIFGKGHIENPVERVLNAPMGTNGVGKDVNTAGKSGHKVASFERDLFAIVAKGFH